MKTLLSLSTLCALGCLLAGRAAVAGPPTVDVTVNGSTVTLSQGVPTTVGGPASGALVPIDIGNVVMMPGTTPFVSGSFTVNGQSLPLTVTVLSSTPSVMQYAISGGATISLGGLGQVTAQPYGGSVQPSSGLVRVPITAALTYVASPSAAPEPSSWAAFGVGLAGLAGLTARRRGKLSRSVRVEHGAAQR